MKTNTNKTSSKRTSVRQEYKSSAGYIFYRDDCQWVLDKNITVFLSTIKDSLHKDMLPGCLDTLIYYATNLSSSHTTSIAKHLTKMLTESNVSKISDTMLINYRSSLSEREEHSLGTIRGFLKKWYELGYPGISSDIIDLLYSWTLKGSVKGERVKSLDPQTGPLTDIELSAFNEGAIQAFESNKITITELAIGLLASNTGRRPIQISRLKIKDILKGKNSEGEDIYILNCPRAKQRGSVFRETFNQLAITKELWVILNLQAREAYSKAKETLTFKMLDRDRLELALFPDYDELSKVKNIADLRAVENKDILHMKAAFVNETVQHIVLVAKIHSERVDGLLPITAYRFRYTVGTRAAREGLGIMVIAELLDHSDNQSSKDYVENVPENVAIIDKAIGRQLAPYAQAFMGVLVDSERDASRGDDLNSRIRTEEEIIGNCGSYGFCGANVPIPCYTCTHFQPWLDAPHEKVLDGLIADNKRILKVTGDKQISSINNRTILAVQDVINRCKIRKEELNNV